MFDDIEPSPSPAEFCDIPDDILGLIALLLPLRCQSVLSACSKRLFLLLNASSFWALNACSFKLNIDVFTKQEHFKQLVCSRALLYGLGGIPQNWAKGYVLMQALAAANNDYALAFCGSIQRVCFQTRRGDDLLARSAHPIAEASLAITKLNHSHEVIQIVFTALRESDQYDPHVNYLLGCYSYCGWGCRKNIAQALKHWERAGNHFFAVFARARYSLTRDLPRALGLYHQLAAQGHQSSQYELGIRYWTGNGLQQDELRAIWWLTMAAQSGYADAMTALAAVYREDVSVRRNWEMAYYWDGLAKQHEEKPSDDSESDSDSEFW